MRRIWGVLLFVLFWAVPISAGELQAITDMRVGIRGKSASSAELVAKLSGDKEALRLAPRVRRMTLAFMDETGKVYELEKGPGLLPTRFLVVLRGEKRWFFRDAPEADYDPKLDAIVVSVYPDEKDLDFGLLVLAAVRRAQLSAGDEILVSESRYDAWQWAFMQRVHEKILKKPENAFLSKK